MNNTIDSEKLLHEIEWRIQNGMAEDALIIMRNYVPCLISELRSAQAKIHEMKTVIDAALDYWFTGNGGITKVAEVFATYHDKMITAEVICDSISEQGHAA